MAKATKVIHRIQPNEEELRLQDLKSIETKMLENKEAIEQLFEILMHLRDRGVLDMTDALFAQGDEVLDILIKTVDSEETTNTIKNLLLMLGTLGTLNVQQLEPLILKLNTGITRVAELDEKKEKAGYLTLLRELNDPDVKRAMAVGITFIKGIGESQDGFERNTQTPSEQEHSRNEKRNKAAKKGQRVKERKISSTNQYTGEGEKSGNSWMVIAAVISILSIPVTLSLKKDSGHK